MKKVSKDLRDLYTQVQGATAVKHGGAEGLGGRQRRRGRFGETDDGDDISVTDVFMGRGSFGGGNLGNSFGLPSIE